jgi:uncharacterized protein (DUF1800 family)
MKCLHAALAALALSFSATSEAEVDAIETAYIAAGLTEHEAGAIVLDRLTYGARAGDVEEVVATGLSGWLNLQLAGELPEPDLDERLAKLEAARMSQTELAARYPNSSQMSAHIRRIEPGHIPERDVQILDFSVVAAKIDEYRAEHGFLTQEQDLHGQLLAQKVLRAVYAENQLREVLTDFWINHLYSSPSSFNARLYTLPYESEALRPNALGDFAVLLKAASKHPAMRSFYVGNEQRASLHAEDTAMAAAIAARRTNGDAAVDALVARARSEIVALEYDDDLVLSREFWPQTGPNLEYARALVEIQTLGPNAQVGPDDLEAIARAFTGWTTMPTGPSPEWYARGLKDVFELGFVREGGFLFRADQHDARAKMVFGQSYPAGSGVEEGERVLDYLAAQPGTARHIAEKLAIRFVSDKPSNAIVKRLTTAFLDNEGNVAEMMLALLESPDFWTAAKARSKVKTPLEYVASALRTTHARIVSAEAIADRIADMGQPLYAYLEPTGYPDNNKYWLDSAALLQRVNFAGQLAANRIPGVSIDMASLIGTSDKPIDPQHALVFAQRLLPGRNAHPSLEAFDDLSSGNSSTDDAAHTLAALIIASPEFQLR